MIQRIQSLYIFLSLVCALLLYLFPIWQTAAGSTDGMQEIGAGTHLLLLPLPVIMAISHLLALFSFKHRKRQKQLCTGNILLYIIFLLGGLLIIQLEHHFFQHFNLFEFSVGAVLPLAGILLNVLARNGIKKDEALLRSMDRLR